MNNAPKPTDAAVAAEETSRTLDAFGTGTADAPGMSTIATPVGTQVDPPDPADEVLVDQAGRPLGPRALKTRRRILEATTALLDEKPLRELRVIDIARRRIDVFFED